MRYERLMNKIAIKQNQHFQNIRIIVLKINQAMSTKIKSNILYIASDNDSEQENQNVQPIQNNEAKIIKNGFSLVGNHRLNNNMLAKGLFNGHEIDEQYSYEKGKQHKNLYHTVQLRRRTPLQSQKSQNAQHIMKVQLPASPTKMQQNQQTNQQNESSVEAVEQKLVKRVELSQKVKRSHTLMFRFNQQSDDVIQKSQQQSKIDQEIRKSIEKAVQQKQLQINCQTKQGKNNQISQKPSNKRTSLTPKDLLGSIDKKQFLLCPVPQDHILQCKVIKKNELSNLLFSQYDVFFRDFFNVHVASCKKYMANLRSNYRISTNQQNFSYSKSNVIGKVRCVADNKDLYNLYDSGINPDNIQQKNPQNFSARQILGTVRIKSGKGPRQVELFLLKSGVSYYSLVGVNLKKQLNLQILYSVQQNRDKIHFYKSRKPQWISTRGQYFLNFDGRVNQASVRNFILEDPQTKRQVLLFGKNQSNVYNLDVSYPLTPSIGLAIVVPQLDRDD